ncbi:hypothetical protein GGR21_003541 [Dysgonomonas hofstadii]|uniref:Putative auto-transporter adhesin head GIN domain-containing protein n=1 Tax=Dysgonomonas hofstadii TaxID=637886 RepID=A0A840CRE0_9BACT|nr:head GIN domain-containing protein [Dysgonomonas hofstadii]MBB4037621.1 hypothetical protein [Dysgonomonas hofstadii]
MKTNCFILITLIFAFNACSSSAQTSGSKRNVSNFSSISVSGGIDVNFTQSNKYTAEIETDAENLPNVEIEVKDGTLEIKRKKGTQFKRNTKVLVYVSAPTLEKLAMSGGSDVNIKDLSTNKLFSVAASGGADLDIEKLSVSECKLAFSGGADCDIKMLKAKDVQLSFSGGSDGEIHLDVEKLTAAASGGADLELSGKVQKASVAASGGSDVNIRNLSGGDISTSKSGGGSIKKN